MWALDISGPAGSLSERPRHRASSRGRSPLINRGGGGGVGLADGVMGGPAKPGSGPYASKEMVAPAVPL